jgi:hypothetical protein
LPMVVISELFTPSRDISDLTDWARRSERGLIVAKRPYGVRVAVTTIRTRPTRLAALTACATTSRASWLRFDCRSRRRPRSDELPAAVQGVETAPRPRPEVRRARSERRRRCGYLGLRVDRVFSSTIGGLRSWAGVGFGAEPTFRFMPRRGLEK